MQLVSKNFGGNLHNAVGAVNRLGLADAVVAMDYTGHATIVVFRVRDEVAPKLRGYFGFAPEYLENPKPEHDWS